MDTSTPTQPVLTQAVPVQPIPPVQPVKKTNTPLIISIVLCVLIISGLVGYILLTGQTGKQQAVTTLPTPTELPVPTTNTIQPTIPVASSSPTAIVSQAVKPTIIPNPDGNTFTSDKLGIAFYWANKTPADQSATVKTSEIGNKVYVYLSNGKPEDGQSIERFDKSPTDTLSQAITKRFLAGIPTSDCFVKIDPKKPKPTVTKATISYPIPANADQPNFTYGEKCPDGYSESNGMAYFFEDSTYPDRFYYVSIGQYGIPAQNSKPDSMWQDTIVVF
jgi:hypothetical protein